jgi:DNA-binding transcriptional MerR regulator
VPELLKMSELAERAGVEKSTIQHYLREGLLPEPALRPHRNMAYYSADLVERIGLIKQLQTERRLPLRQIKQLLSDRRGLGELRRWLDRHALVPDPVAVPMPRAELLAATGLSRDVLDRLEDLRFLRPIRRGRSILYPPADVAVVRSVAAMRDAGLDESNGFALEELQLYMDAMRSLLVDELALFSRVLGKLSRAQVAKLAESGLAGTSALLQALRQRLVLDLLDEGAPASPTNGGT